VRYIWMFSSYGAIFRLKLAIFGGTFDPVHWAHLIVAREAADQFALDQVLLIPAANPPHKSDTTTAYEHRYRMVELACQEDPRFIPSRLEEGLQKSYSYNTIRKVIEMSPQDDVYFLIGADAFAEIESWHRSAEVLQMVKFIVVTRPGHAYVTPPGARVCMLETLALPVSSSEVRQILAAGGQPGELPPAVLNYIREHGLYATHSQ
jgi:nicotinate-nucleotide adenylyltransferase